MRMATCTQRYLKECGVRSILPHSRCFGQKIPIVRALTLIGIAVASRCLTRGRFLDTIGIILFVGMLIVPYVIAILMSTTTRKMIWRIVKIGLSK